MLYHVVPKLERFKVPKSQLSVAGEQVEDEACNLGQLCAHKTRQAWHCKLLASSR